VVVSNTGVTSLAVNNGITESGSTGGVTLGLGAITPTSVSTGDVTSSTLTASSAVATDSSKKLVSVTNTGTGNNVLATSPTLSGASLGNTTLTGTLTAGGSAGTSGYFLQTTGTGVQWAATSGGGGTVTSVGTAGSVNGITISGGPITTSGTITLGGTLGSIANSQLSNSSITVTAGTGLSGGGSVSLGGTTTLTNAGVTSISAGTGISVSGSTGGVTITNTVSGLPSGGSTSQVILKNSSGSAWYTEHFNVKAFGAVGNGSTDDTANINSAIAALNSAGGGVLYFPKGNYLVNYTYNTALTTITVPCRIIGDGHGHSVAESATCISKYNTSSSNFNVFTFNTSNPVNFEDLTISFAASTSAYGIYFNGPSGTPVDYSTINRVSVICPSGTSSTGIYSYNGNNTRITNCYIAGHSYGIYLTSDTGDADSPDGGVAFITNCVIESNTSAGVYHTSSGGLNVVGNQFHSNGYAYRYVALNTIATSDIVFTSNWIDVWTYAISFEGPSSSGTLTNVIIADNTFAALTGFAFNGQNVIQVINGSNKWFHECVISGNSFQFAQGAAGSGIYLTNCYDVMIGVNFFYAAGSYAGNAIYIDSSTCFIQWDNNQLFFMANGSNAISDNQGISLTSSSSIYTYASASLIYLGKVGYYATITGTTTNNGLVGGWQGRFISFYIQDGMTFTGGNIKNALTAAAGTVVQAYFDGTYWYLK
jgi:hypothetical protein